MGSQTQRADVKAKEIRIFGDSSRSRDEGDRGIGQGLKMTGLISSAVDGQRRK